MLGPGFGASPPQSPLQSCLNVHERVRAGELQPLDLGLSDEPC